MDNEIEENQNEEIKVKILEFSTKINIIFMKN